MKVNLEHRILALKDRIAFSAPSQNPLNLRNNNKRT